MTPQEFAFLRKILKERSGLNLGEDKQEILEGRLRPLLKEFALSSVSALVVTLMRPGTDHLRTRLAQAVTVQESYFFRNKTPFHYFGDVLLPRLMKTRRSCRRIRVWCAAAAAGQEPYSLAMELAERERQLIGWTVEIVATDFAEDALRKARKGIYSQFEVQRGLPVSLLVKYFQKVGTSWEISPDIRARVAFREHNLLDDCQDLGPFDVIFCRNVLIYFDEATKRAVLARLASGLASDGYLVLGAAETTTGLSHDFVAVPERHHGIFRLTPAAAAAKAGREAAKLEAGEGAPERDAAPHATQGALRLGASPR